jgi:hypothetical protein
MARIKKKQVDAELLDAIFALERDWKQIQKIGAQSIERTPYSRSMESLARARYLYLLREARHRKINALDR